MYSRYEDRIVEFNGHHYIIDKGKKIIKKEYCIRLKKATETSYGEVYDCTATAKVFTCLASYANCHKNAYITKVNQNLKPNCLLNVPQNPPRIPYLEAYKPIDAGDELIFDYGSDFDFDEEIPNANNNVVKLGRTLTSYKKPLRENPQSTSLQDESYKLLIKIPFIKKKPINANPVMRPIINHHQQIKKYLNNQSNDIPPQPIQSIINNQSNDIPPQPIQSIINTQSNDIPPQPIQSMINPVNNNGKEVIYNITILDYNDLFTELRIKNNQNNPIVRVMFNIVIKLDNFDCLIKYESEKGKLQNKSLMRYWLDDYIVNAIGSILCDQYNSEKRKCAFLGCHWYHTLNEQQLIENFYVEGKSELINESRVIILGLIDLTAEVVVLMNNKDDMHWTLISCFLHPNDDSMPEIVYIDSQKVNKNFAEERMNAAMNMINILAIINQKDKYKPENWKKHILSYTQTLQKNCFDCGI